MECKIVIPSYRRPDRVKTIKACANTILCVTEEEKHLYAENYPNNEIVVHPDKIKGISITRQWIYDYFGDVIMLDDDIRQMRRLYTETADLQITSNIIDADTCYQLWQNLYNLAKKAGSYLFSFANNCHKMFYNPLSPFSLTGWINFHSFGIINSRVLKFNPDIVACDDYWMSGLNAFFHRYIIQDNRFFMEHEKTLKNIGGLSNFRTTETERKDTELLKKSFGKAIQERKGYGKKSHQHMRTLKIPF